MSELAVKRMTLAEFLRWEDGTDTRYELLDGIAVAMPLQPVAHGVMLLASAVQSGRRCDRDGLARRNSAPPLPPMVETIPVISPILW
jgi:Uma2 family endonuclease